MKPRQIGMLVLVLVVILAAVSTIAQGAHFLLNPEAGSANRVPGTLPALHERADKGDKQAQYELGQAFERGTSTPRNVPQAIHWYELSAQQDYMPAERELGLLYLQGHGVPQDFALARKWLERAAHDGSNRAQFELGKMFEHGYDRPADPVMAYVWYDFAAAQGNTVASTARDTLAKKLSQYELSEAQRIAQRIAPSVLGENAVGL